MKIVVFVKDADVTEDMIDKSTAIVTVNPDKKGFVIDRQVALSNTRLFMKHLGYERHISQLKHILLATKEGVK